MSDYKVSNFNIFDDATTTTANTNTNVTTSQDIFTQSTTKINDQSIFMGPAQEECANQLNQVNSKVTNISSVLGTISNTLDQTKSTYQTGDEKAQNALNKNIDTNSVISGSNVANAATKYKDEIDKAEYATVKGNLFSTTSNDTINGQPVKVTHVVINNGNQINGAPANGSYASGLETSSSAAQRLNSPLLINGSHFSYDDGSEDLKGNNHVVIVNGQIKHDGTSGGNELLLDKNGNIYNASGKTAQQLVDDGVKYSFSCHSTQVIENGDTSPSYRETKQYKRTVIGQSAPGEYYIVTDTTYNNNLSDTAEYLKSKGCTNAYSMDQGGSVSLVRDGKLINNPSDDNGERAVGDFLYFTT